MIIKLSPKISDETMSLVRAGDTLIVNGVGFDFGPLPDGATLPASAVGSDLFVDVIERLGGQLSLTLCLQHAADAPESARFPADIVDPPDGQIYLPGQEVHEHDVQTSASIDWAQIITAEQKAQASAEQLLALVQSETSRRRAVADAAIAPLQDAVDLDEATEAEVALLKEWKRYRIALNRLPDQSGYPQAIDWPAPPA